MAEGVEAAVECGFCLRKGGDLEKPKVLPCTHGHCLPCLMGFYEVNQMLQCPLLSCGKVFEVPITTLPSLTTALPACVQCDSCNKKGDEQMAVVYCTQCKRKYCTNHLESHDDVLADHDKISIDDYKVKVKKLEVRECDEHKGEPYSLGCKHCLKLICVKCMAGLDQQCTAWGCSHELVSLDELIAALIDENIRAKMLMEEEHLERLFKLTSKYSAEFDDETEQMVESLNKTRAEQIQAIEQKYQAVEKKLVEERKGKKIEIETFLDNKLLKRWMELRNQRLKIESKLEHTHKVDVVIGYKELKSTVDKMLQSGTPTLEPSGVAGLIAKEEKRDEEIKIGPCEKTTIDHVNGVTRSKTASIASKLVRTVQLPNQPFALCHHGENVYVGFPNRTIRKLQSDYGFDSSFPSTTGVVESVTVYNSRVYALLREGSSHVVKIFDMDRHKVEEWIHSRDYNCNMNALCAVSNQVVVADWYKDQITVYSLKGAVQKRISFTFRSGFSYIGMCRADDSSVVISDNKSSAVSRLDIRTGKVMWTVNDINKPLGVAYHESGFFPGGQLQESHHTDTRCRNRQKRIRDYR